MRTNSAIVVSVLAETLRNDKASFVRGSAAEALSRMGKADQTVVPALLAALNDEAADVREQAGRALKRIDPEAAANAGVK